MKNNIIIAVLLVSTIFFAFQSKPKQQFFVVGEMFYINDEYESTFRVEFTDKPAQIFHSRYELLKYMNGLGYECVSHTFLMGRNSYAKESNEFFIFE